MKANVLHEKSVRLKRSFEVFCAVVGRACAVDSTLPRFEIEGVLKTLRSHINECCALLDRTQADLDAQRAADNPKPEKEVN